MYRRCWAWLLMLNLLATAAAAEREVIDAAGRRVTVPEAVERVICSGPGALRLLTYLQAQDLVVAVDDIEKRRPQFDARPYALANPRYKTLPVFGEFRGFDHPELILSLNPQPQVIFKTYGAMGHDPRELQVKTGIPVVVLEYGDLGRRRETLCHALRLMARVIGREKRAEAVIGFFEAGIADLTHRTRDIPETDRPGCYVGGIAFKGPHGFISTEPGYPPFRFAGARNLAFDPSRHSEPLEHSLVAKEKILAWDPDHLFVDLSTLQMGAQQAGALHELRTDPAYRALSAVGKGRVYGLLPYNWYTQNFGSILANAYYIGALLYPERFADVDPAVKADEIYAFLVGRPVFQPMKAAFGGLAFERIPVR